MEILIVVLFAIAFILWFFGKINKNRIIDCAGSFIFVLEGIISIVLIVCNYGLTGFSIVMFLVNLIQIIIGSTSLSTELSSLSF
jgi:hypothetical protein